MLEREQCTNQGILSFIYQNVIYPDTAIQQKLEGMVVVEIVIGKKGIVTGSKLIKDIGGGCGASVMAVLKALESAENLWLPAAVDEVPVDYSMTIPVKFNLPKPPPPPLPYQIIGKDTIYHEYSTLPQLVTGENEMERMLNEELKYPANYKDSCLVGTMNAQVVISREGNLRIVDVIDYENLGFDFQFELIQLINSTSGKWQAGTYDGKPVHVVYDLYAKFFPKGNGCEKVAADFKTADVKITAGNKKYLANDFEGALTDWNAAIDLFPNNAAFRLIRGQALLDRNHNAVQCCEDLTMAQEKTTLDPLTAGALTIICKQAAQQEDLEEKEVEGGVEKN